MMRYLCFILVCVSLVGCGKSKKSQTKYANALSAVSLTINVYYEEGAEPYAGGLTVPQTSLPLKYWDLLQKNLESLFLGRDRLPAIKVPKELKDMNLLGKGSTSKRWSIDDALNMAAGVPAPSSESFNIFFVNGRAEENINIIGFNLTGKNIIFIFKEVIAQTGSGVGIGDLVPKFVEQATLIHEMGHAIGLVNNGLAMKTNHEDHAHKHHCNNENCVMYYANEGTESLIRFAQSRATNFDLVMFDDHCLNDARAYRP